MRRTIVGVYLASALLLGSCIEFGESENIINAPIALEVQVFFGSSLGARADGWPEFSLELSTADAATLGSESSAPFVYRDDGGRDALAEARITATNYIVETADDRVDVPCLADPIVAVIAATGKRIVVQDAGFCMKGRSFEMIEVEADVLLEAMQESP